MRSPPHFATLVLLTAVSVLSLNMILPSLPGIAVDFGTSYASASLLVSGYLAVTALLQPLIGPLADRYGRRPVLLGVLFLFTLASAGAALAPDFTTLAAFRALQGAAIGGYVVALAVVRDTRSDANAAGMIGKINMAMALAPMLGPIVGGVLEATLGWRAGFAILALAGAGTLAICWRDFGETRPAQTGHTETMLSGAGALLRSGVFRANALCMAFTTGAFYTFLAGAPYVAQVGFGLSPSRLGFVIATTTCGFMFGSFLSGRYSARAGLIPTLLAGRLVACLGLTVGLVLELTGLGGLGTFIAATLCVGTGNGLSVPSASAGAMSIRPELSGTAAGLSGALVVAFGAVATTFTGYAVTGANPQAILLALMLATSGAGLAAALVVRKRGPG